MSISNKEQKKLRYIPANPGFQVVDFREGKDPMLTPVVAWEIYANYTDDDDAMCICPVLFDGARNNGENFGEPYILHPDNSVRNYAGAYFASLADWLEWRKTIVKKYPTTE
jgi:hypothetical protein